MPLARASVNLGRWNHWTPCNRWTDRLRDRARAGTFFRFLAKRFLDDNLFEAAGALSFTTVFALVPLSMVVFGVLSAFPVFDEWSDRSSATTSSPTSCRSAARSVEAYLEQFSGNAGQLTTAGVIALVVSLLITLSSVEATFNRIWRVQTARPKFGRFLVYWTVLTLGALVAAASLALSARFFALAVFETSAGQHAGNADAAAGADGDRAAGLRRDLQGGAAPHDQVAACGRRRAAGDGAVRSW